MTQLNATLGMSLLGKGTSSAPEGARTQKSLQAAGNGKRPMSINTL